jgi:hypothetical protein
VWVTGGTRRRVNQENPPMRIYIIGNDGITLCREAPATVSEGEIAVASKSGERIEFRVGINLGDVIAEGEDIFGDGVNIAARLETLADPGGICISLAVRDQIRDKLPYPFEDGGEQSVKNIARPVRVYLLRPGAVAAVPVSGMPPITSISQPPIAPRLSIVVLPFAISAATGSSNIWRTGSPRI